MSNASALDQLANVAQTQLPVSSGPSSSSSAATTPAAAGLQAPSGASTTEPATANGKRKDGGEDGENKDEQHRMTRKEEEEARKDRSLAEFLLMLDGYQPLIPDEVTDYYLQKSGFDCQDVRLKRLLSLAAQKFVADIATDAFQYARIRTTAGPGGKQGKASGGGGGGGGGGGSGSGGGTGPAAGQSAAGAAAAGARDRARTVLTMDDLSAALSEYGIDSRRADHFL